MSKLQALAAKRRQQAAQKSSSTESDQSPRTDDYTQSLNKLRISQSKAAAKKDSEAAPMPDSDTVIPDANQELASQPITEEKQKDGEEEVVSSQSLRAQPSAFASTLTFSTSDLAFPSPEVLVDSKTHPRAFDFAEPSPDDLVSKAQKRLRD